LEVQSIAEQGVVGIQGIHDEGLEGRENEGKEQGILKGSGVEVRDVDGLDNLAIWIVLRC
jgi:hypothetical protein